NASESFAKRTAAADSRKKRAEQAAAAATAKEAANQKAASMDAYLKWQAEISQREPTERAPRSKLDTLDIQKTTPVEPACSPELTDSSSATAQGSSRTRPMPNQREIDQYRAKYKRYSRAVS